MTGRIFFAWRGGGWVWARYWVLMKGVWCEDTDEGGFSISRGRLRQKAWTGQAEAAIAVVGFDVEKVMRVQR